MGLPDVLFRGRLARFGEALAFAGDARTWLSGDDFLQAHTLGRLQACFRPQFAAADPRGLASVWSKQYFQRLLPPLLCAALAGYRLPLRFESLWVAVDEQGMPLALRLPHRGEPFLPDDPEARFAVLLDDHLAPLIEALRAASGLSAKVLWSNAGNYFEAFLRHLAGLGELPFALADGDAFLQMRLRGEGRRNPLYRPVLYLEAEHDDGLWRAWRKRRLCCIRDLLPGVGLCPNCPRLDRPPAPEAAH